MVTIIVAKYFHGILLVSFNSLIHSQINHIPLYLQRISKGKTNQISLTGAFIDMCSKNRVCRTDYDVM